MQNLICLLFFNAEYNLLVKIFINNSLTMIYCEFSIVTCYRATYSKVNSLGHNTNYNFINNSHALRIVCVARQ